MKILITGASGFIGSFIVEEGLARGMKVWAGMRGSSSKKYLSDERIRFAELNLENAEVLHQQLEQYKAEFGGWDFIVHAAGATKCKCKQDFFRTNYEGTKNLVEALQRLDMVPKKFIFISSLSVYGAIREVPVKDADKISDPVYAPIIESDTPRPNTAYGQSKLQAEKFLQQFPDSFPYVILRPTGVYGPREKDYFLMAQSIKQHIDFAVGYKPQEITFVYVRDLVQAVYRSIDADVVRRAYFISDGKVYGSRDFSDLLQRELGNPWVLHIKAPIWFLRLICMVVGTVSTWLGKTSTLNTDKYHILCQRNWQCDVEPACKELGYKPEYTLERGVKESVAWYVEEGWL